MYRPKKSTVSRPHPIHGLSRSLLAEDPELILEFSRYVHLGSGRTLSREIFHVHARDLNDTWLAEEISGLAETQELALHSKVVQKNRIFHIPMVDFARV